MRSSELDDILKIQRILIYGFGVTFLGVAFLGTPWVVLIWFLAIGYAFILSTRLTCQDCGTRLFPNKSVAVSFLMNAAWYGFVFFPPKSCSNCGRKFERSRPRAGRSFKPAHVIFGMAGGLILITVWGNITYSNSPLGMIYSEFGIRMPEARSQQLLESKLPNGEPFSVVSLDYYKKRGVHRFCESSKYRSNSTAQETILYLERVINEIHPPKQLFDSSLVCEMTGPKGSFVFLIDRYLVLVPSAN